MWTTTDGSTFGFTSTLTELVASRIGFMISSNRNNPPTAVREASFTSPDGLVWTNVSNETDNFWDQTVGARVNTIFYLQVADVWFIDLATGSSYFTSTDGIAWTIGVFPGAPSVIAADAYMTDGVWDFILANNVLWATQDGLIWESRGTLSSCIHLVFDPNLTPSYWAFGQSFSNARLQSSVDGTLGSWATHVAGQASLNATTINWNQPLAATRSRDIGITVFGAMQTGTGTAAAIHATSPDNIVWTESPAGARGFGLRYSATLGEFVKVEHNFATGELNRSSDGINWTQHQFAAFPALGEWFGADLLTSF